MWSFGWNDVALYIISIVGITIVLSLRYKYGQFKHKQEITYAIFISIAILAALASAAIKADSIGTLTTRAIIFEAVSIYFLSNYNS